MKMSYVTNENTKCFKQTNKIFHQNMLSLKGMSHSHSHVHAVPTDEPAHHAVPTVQHHGTRTVPTVQYHDAEPSQPTSPPPTPAIYKECRLTN